MNGIIGKKLGMTQVFDDKGQHAAVTVIATGPCVVVQRKTVENDGYNAVQLGFLDQKEQRLTKAAAGHFKKGGVTAKRILKEFRLEDGEELKAGDAVSANIFDGVPYVDIIGVTKGRGFQGVVKRHDMAGGPAAHGHMSHRRVGAIGQRTWPARILKNKRMPGHMGNVSITVQNLRVVQVRPDDHVILVEGAVPGPTGGIIVVRKAVKKKAAKKS
ncbi:MAG: 50S ribosomal protein L3 [bacterium]